MKLYIPTTNRPPFGFPGQRSHYEKTTQKSQVYDAIYKAGKDGIGRRDVATAVGLAPDRISFYLSDLKRAGYIDVRAEPVKFDAEMPFDEAAMIAMLALENAMVCKVKQLGKSTDEMNRSYVKYCKCKELALRPGTGAEGVVAMRMSLIELVKTIW